VDVSSVALINTRKVSVAECAVALAEYHSYPSGSIDVVISIGVMKQLLDVRRASAEVLVVLRAGGRHIVDSYENDAVVTRQPEVARICVLSEAACLYAVGKKESDVRQKIRPMNNSYTFDKALEVSEKSGHSSI